MAAGGADLHRAVRETLLVCPVCREDFALASRPPRLLPCFHCCCQPCLARLGQSSPLRCPLCRSAFSAEDVFLLDTTRTTLLELTEQISKEGAHAQCCQGCSQSLPAQSWCQHCAQVLCQHCCQAHHQLNILKDHKLVPLSEVTEEKMRQSQVVEKCKEHPMERLKFFCENCDAAACGDCAILLHSGHRLAGLEAVVEERKKQVQSWCQKVETALPAFQDREASSHARLQRLDTKLQDKVQQVENFFSRIVSKVMARQDNVLADLKAKAKGQRLKAEEQHCQDQSAVESANTMVEHGRRVVSFGLATQLLGLPRRMEEAFGRLQRSQQAVVEPLPDLLISDADLPTLLTYVERVGEIEVGKRPFACPEFRLTTVQSPKASVDVDSCAVSNQPGPRAMRSTRGELNGTTTTEAAPDTSCYWQVRCLVKSNSRVLDSIAVCDVGICEPKSLLNNFTWHVCAHNQTASAVTLTRFAGYVKITPFIEAEKLADIPLAAWPQDAPLDITLGFLLDRPQRRLHVIDVTQAKVLVSREISMDTPLWPVLCVCPKDEIRADVRLELQSGAKMNVSGDVIKLLKSLLTQ